jgi:hypothetical protein
MKKHAIMIIILLFLLSFGCISQSAKLTNNGFCYKVRDMISDNFGIIGLYMEQAQVTGDDAHYCEYSLGKTVVLQLIYSKEDDIERAYADYLVNAKTNVPANQVITDSKSTENGNMKTIYVVTKNLKNNAIKITAGAFSYNYSTSAIVTAIYEPGKPNPFATSGSVLRDISVKSISIAQ